MGTSILIKYEFNLEKKSTKFMIELKKEKETKCYLEICVFHLDIDSGFTPIGHGGNTGKE